MDVITGIFTKRLHPMSVAIRIATRPALLQLAPASHVVIRDGDFGIEATFGHGVRRVPLEECLHGAEVVATRDYEVPFREMGMSWLRKTAERNAKYDTKGAFAVGVSPDRNWQEDDDWFCFELLANGLYKAGRRIFLNHAHITSSDLLKIHPAFPRLKSECY